MPGPTILIAGQTGRALAQSARACGYVPLVADLFADVDTHATAHAVERVASLSRADLLPTLDALRDRAGGDVIGCVCGSGFEDRVDVLRAIAARHGLIGNAPDVVARAKDPFAFAALCAALGLPHPRVATAPDGPGTWLRKQAGGSGGTHIADAPAAGASLPPTQSGYWQRKVAGEPAGALFLADGLNIRVLAITRQWTAPSRDQPYRYGGAAFPAELTAGADDALRDAATKLVPALGLRGLNALDALVRDDGGITVLEVNTRPGATMNLFAEWPVFGWHVDACAGKLPGAVAPPLATAAIAGVDVWASGDRTIAPTLAWPDWAADRPAAGTVVRTGEPLCTVLAAADDPHAARALADSRARLILTMTERTA